MRAGLTRRTVVASAVLALIIGAAFAILIRAVRQERDSGRLAQHSSEVLVSANALQRLVLDLETGTRGYLLTGEDRFLAPWRSARAAAPRASEDLLRLTQVRAQHLRAERLTAAIAAYLRGYSVPLVTAARRGDASARSVAAAADGKRRVDGLRLQFDDLIAAERQLSAQRDDASERDARVAIFAATAGLVGSIVLIALFGGYMTRAVVSPLRRAAAMAGRLAGGDLAARMPETGTAEIGNLQRSFNTMGRSLETNRDELRLLADEQAALRRLATLVAGAAAPTDVFDAAGAEAGRLLGADATTVVRFEPDGTATVLAARSAAGDPPPVGERVTLEPGRLAATVLREGRPARRRSEDAETWSPALLGGPDIRVAIGTPVFVADRVWGALLAGWKDPARVDDATEGRLAQFTSLVATAIANADSREELAASRARVVATADATRRRIERDLHDGAQQRLVHTIVTLKLARRELGEGVPGGALVGEALEQAEAATAALRELVHGILPSALSHGLEPAVEGLVARLPVRVSIAVTSERLPEALERTAYFVVAEALTNVVKHAGAQSARVTVDIDGATLHVEVADDGVGGARLDGSSGLLGLQDRVAALNGELSIESPPGTGTTLVARLPIHG
jgi:signal transduction histidine kinase